MVGYPNSNTFVPTDGRYCPKCGTTDLKDNGECSEGCCDDYICNQCKYKFRIENFD
jgi:transposase-like protein